MLGKFQTDQLENRFGIYRRMSGCNYNVSVTQILESEKKLKIMNLLKVQSSDSKTCKISNLLDTAPDTAEGNELVDIKEKFPSLFEQVSESEIGDHDASVLMYISGYVAFSVGKRLQCSFRMCRLSRASELDWEMSEDVSEYLTVVDRGGLKWPTDFTVNLCTNTYLLFRGMVSQHEKEFLECENQRATLMSCAYAFSARNHDEDETCSCSRSLGSVMKLCLRSFSNIFLNNFSKVKNDGSEKCKSKEM